MYNGNMSVQFIRDDITKIKADAVVNTANPFPIIGAGTDSAIYHAAGADQLLAERKKIGNITPGDACITPGFALSPYIIHTVGPGYIDGTHGEAETLRSCYRNSLLLAKQNQCSSIVFPLIATGVYGFPKEEAIAIAVNELNHFLISQNSNMHIMIAVFDQESYNLCLRITKDITANIDSAASDDALKAEYGKEYDAVQQRHKEIKRARLIGRQKKRKHDLPVSEDTRSFVDMIFYYMNILELKPAEVYKNADIDRRQYSRIINKDYNPSKKAVIRLSIGLRLTLEQTIDLLARADFAFNPSRPDDLAIMRGIRNRKTLKEIRAELEELGLHPDDYTL